jgi:predicted ATPase
LFVGGEDAGGDAKTAGAEFARTASRLTEMQSAHYLQLERVQR